MSTHFLSENKTLFKTHDINEAETFLERNMKKKPSLNIEESTFGKRLARIRRSCSLTQTDLGKKVGLSKRMVAYYECQSQHIPSTILPALAKTLRVTTDELLGLKNLKIKDPEISMRLQTKLRLINKLSPRQRKSVTDFIEGLYLKQTQSKNGTK